MLKKRYNPKSNAPALFVPCWLSQIPIKKLTPGAKIMYGRLAQWSNETGDVYRASPQLALEIGSSTRQTERYLKELRDAGLIDTFQETLGGQNHFIFYEHPWMFEPIVKELTYKNDPPTHLKNLSSNLSLPPDISVGTPPTYTADINIIEIKNKKDLKHLSSDRPKDTKKKNIISAKDYAQDERFMRFYNAYPIKKKGAHAYKMWLRLNPDDMLLETILADIKARREQDTQWIEGYCPHPGTYLNPECPGWTDDIVNRDKLKAQNKAIEKQAKQAECDKRTQAQAELSRKNADYERAKQENQDKDGAVFRDIVNKVAPAPKELKDLITRLRKT